MKRVVDIKKSGNRRINLSAPRFFEVSFNVFSKVIFVSLIAIFFVFIFGSAIAPTAFVVSRAAETTSDAEAKKKELQKELAEYERQIEEYEATISDLKKQGKSLNSDIKGLDAKIAKLNVQIKAVTLTLKKLDEEIFVTVDKIKITEKDISFNKKALSDAISKIYENEEKEIIELLLINPHLSDFFTDLNSFMAIQENIKISLKKIIELKNELIDEKENLSLQKADAATLKAYKDSQKTDIQKTKKEKDDLLVKTKGKESEYKKILTETKKTAAEIRKQIFKFIGGGELSFEKAFELASFAEKATGIRAAFLLAILDRESALGKNVGQCDYKTAMHPRRDIPIFLDIIEELGLKSDLENGIIKVSCANSDGAFGGAIGPAQFIPSTWVIYKDKIAGITGNNPPSPWKNSDAFAATALYLKDALESNSCVAYSNENSNVSPRQKLLERCAAAKYYAGSRWYSFRWVYGDPVIEKAAKFQDDIEILNGQLGIKNN